LNSINAAADYLKEFAWVDSTKMGLVGHSLGGFATNYFITHTNRFTAAVSESSASNMIQMYNALWKKLGMSQQAYWKAIGFKWDLNENPKLYFDNSPVTHTKDIQTPLLLMHNMEDDIAPVDQSIQLFVNLRSQKKPVWLLQYGDEGHTIEKEENQIDFQDKIKGFFDHYLKDQSMPKWMSDHISPTSTN
jgi:dipeptidyl aminopeptidase/acylaminoacyl peptidase